MLGRILFGGYFAMMGMMHFMKMKSMTDYAKSKKVTSPQAMVALSGIFLLLGGLGVLLGVYIGLSVILLIVFLFVVSFKMHNFWADEDPNMKMMNMSHFLKNMALIGAALLLLSIPAPWMYSIL